MTSDHPRHHQVQEATELVEAHADPQTLPVNVYEAGDALVVIAPVPAVQPEDVTVTVSPAEIVIDVGLRSAGPKDYLRHEWRYGNFYRRLQVPGDVPAGFGAEASAVLANGQLSLRFLRGDARGEQRVEVTPPGQA